MLSKYITSAVIFTLSVFVQHQLTDAFCPGNFRGEGSVTFYWKEKSEDREPQMRNWGVLQEKLEENKYKELTEYFDPKYVYAYTVEGECCWKIFNETNFKGPEEKLILGFSGVPRFPQFNVNSVRKVPC